MPIFMLCGVLSTLGMFYFIGNSPNKKDQIIRMIVSALAGVAVFALLTIAFFPAVVNF